MNKWRELYLEHEEAARDFLAWAGKEDVASAIEEIDREIVFDWAARMIEEGIIR